MDRVKGNCCKVTVLLEWYTIVVEVLCLLQKDFLISAMPILYLVYLIGMTLSYNLHSYRVPTPLDGY